MEYQKVTSCRVCGSKKLKAYLDLGNQPLANALQASKYSAVKKYPLQVLFCEDCALSQLSIVVNPEILYADYPYHSSVSETFKKHCAEMARTVKAMFAKGRIGCVIDVAANDGCLLEQFQKEGFDWPYAVEPSKNLADECKAKGFQTSHAFWNRDISVPRAQVITATNVLAHVHDVREFVETIGKNLTQFGEALCVIEVPYLNNLITKNQFDTIYHEHLSYFLFKPLQYLFDSCGLRIFKVEEMDIHGGSLRLYACHKKFYFAKKTIKCGSGKDYSKTDYAGMSDYIHANSEAYFPTDSSVAALLDFEADSGLYEFKTYVSYQKRVRAIRGALRNLLIQLREDGKKVMGYGASAKGTMLMNYCNIDSTLVQSVVDDTRDKQGKMIPGCSIPIVDNGYFTSTRPDYIVLLSWNFASELKKKTRHLEATYITPIPKVKVE